MSRFEYVLGCASHVLTDSRHTGLVIPAVLALAMTFLEPFKALPEWMQWTILGMSAVPLVALIVLRAGDFIGETRH